eukprot:PITA_14475
MATSSSAIHEAEEVAQETESTQKVDPKSPLRKYVTTVGKIQGGGSLAWVCSECKKEFKGSYTRVKAHLLGLRNNGVCICSGPLKENGKDGNGLNKIKIAKYRRKQDEADAKANEANPASHLKHPTRLGASSSKPPLYSHGIVGSKRSSLGPLEKSFNNDAREIADAAVAQCIYANGLSFNLVRSPYWAKMVKCLNEAPRGYKSPGYENIRTTLLSAQKLDLEAKLAPIRDSWLISGVSIISDEWKDQRNRPLINVIAQSPHGAMFFKAVDCEGQMKDSQFIANILIEAIELVGPENVVQSLNLMLSKLGKQIEWIRKIFEEAKEIQAFITNHHMSQGLYKEFAKLELLKVVETRFASHIIVLTRLMQVKDALQSMVCSSLWNQWRQSQSDRTQAMKRLVVNDESWDKLEYLLAFTKPIVDLLRMFDTDMPNLGEVYEGIDSMIEKIRLVINAKENDPDEIFYREVNDILTKRWNKMTTPLHLLAYALNPKYYAAELLRDPERSTPNKDPEVAEGFKNAFKKLFVDPEIGLQIRAQFSHFVGSEGWGCDIECMRDKSRLSPIEWWNFYGGALPHIQKLAIKVL